MRVLRVYTQVFTCILLVLVFTFEGLCIVFTFKGVFTLILIYFDTVATSTHLNYSINCNY